MKYDGLTPSRLASSENGTPSLPKRAVLKRCALISSLISRASGLAVANRSVASISNLDLTPAAAQLGRHGQDLGLVLGRARQWPHGIEECPQPSRTEKNVDAIGSDVDALDQRGQQGALARSGQVRPAVADFRRSRAEPTLLRQIRKPYCLVDAAGIEKPLAHPAGHELLDLPGWDPQPGEIFGPFAGDQRARDIVTVACSSLDRMARRHAIAIAIKQHPGERARLARGGVEWRTAAFSASCA